MTATFGEQVFYSVARALAFGLALALGGCGCEGEPAGTIESDTPVTVVRDDGDFARIKTPDGQKLYVPSGALKQKSQADDSTGTHTHVITAPTPAYRGGRPAYITRPPPRTEMEIVQEQAGLNLLFLSERTHRIVIAPGNSEPSYQGEYCWPAYTCTNPDCPGEPMGKYPFLFIHTDKSIPNAICPACLPLRDLTSETEADEQRYRNYPKRYHLPETLRRQEELGAELRHRYEFEREERLKMGIK